jgi:DNA replication protein DnaC
MRLRHPTLEKLQTLRLTGMVAAFHEPLPLPDVNPLSFEERLGLLVDRELLDRANRRLQSRLRQAQLRQSATLEDLDYRTPRGVDKTRLPTLATTQWVQEHHNVLITGATGVGKTWVACGVAHAACRQGYRVLYLRIPRFWRELAIARGDGRYPKFLASLAKLDLLVLDDFGLAPLTDDHRRDFLELVEDRHGARASIVTSQLPVEHWHAVIGDPTLADAILDRLVHNAYKIPLKGDSRRKRPNKLTVPPQTE